VDKPDTAYFPVGKIDIGASGPLWGAAGGGLSGLAVLIFCEHRRAR
jgi:hypothetical protein